ncbi:MAG: hypothetical protein NC434_10340 [Ruminococcus sp.]|nr:hypothetical protein [Ruminococcus sp.]
MKRRTKKLVFPLLMSGIMIGSNVCYVCAQGQIADVAVTAEAPVAVSEPESSVTVPEAQPAAMAQAEQTVQPTATDTQTEQMTQPAATDTQTEQAAQPAATDTQTEQVAQPAATDTQTEQTTQPESETQTEGTTETNGDVQNEADVVTPEQGIDVETGEGTENDTESTDVTGEVLPDDAAAADGAEELPEQTFVNASGEEVLPSTLVGVDYNTVSELYDGAANVIKQYVISDTCDKDTVMECYVDENGSLVMLISQGVPKSEMPEEEAGFVEKVAYELEAVFGDSSSAPAIDGSFTGWDDIPASYEFNWNKPDAWVDGVHYTETNSTDVRHEMKLYSDGENVYLKVIFAREFCNGQVANGNDYQFWIDDGQMAAYQVEWPDGSNLANSGSIQPGVYQVDVRHRDSSWSYVLTDGAVAYYCINEGNLNNELELKIPISEFVKQNPNIDLDNYSKIGFFTPNLMQDKIWTAGASTGAEPFAAAMFLLVPTSYIVIKKKDKKEMAFA